MEQREEIIVNGYAYPSISPAVLTNWMKDLTFVTAFSYGFTPEGDLVQLDDEKIIAAARENGVEPLMALAPFDESGRFSSDITRQMLQSPESQKRLIGNLLANLNEKGLFGVDFNFEFIDAADKGAYTSFIAEAAIRLNDEGYLALVALPPKQSADENGILTKGIDYEGIGQAANLVLLLTFEWGKSQGRPMAASPLNEMQRAIDHAAAAIPPSKILLGIPNYGYDFPMPFAKGKKAKRVSHDEAMEAARTHEADILFDETAQSPYFQYTDEAGIDHVVWFEDERSVRAKLALIAENGLAGASFWNIMKPFPAASEALNSMYTVKKIV